MPLARPNIKPTIRDGREVKPVPMPEPELKPTKINGGEVKPVPLLEPKFKTKSFDGTGNEAKPEQLPPADGERTVEIYGKKYKIKTVDGPFQMNVGARDVVIDGKTIHLAPNETIEFLSGDTY